MKPCSLSIFAMIMVMIGAISSCNQTGKQADKTMVAAVKENGSLKNKPELKTDPINPIPGNLPADKELPQNDTTRIFDFLKKFDGKYPYEVKFLDKPVIKQRLTALLGSRFAYLKKTWAVETPIEIKNDIFVASGCEAHNCSDTNFMIVIDIANNLVYAGIREEQKVKLYTEKGRKAPKALLDWENGK